MEIISLSLLVDEVCYNNKIHSFVYLINVFLNMHFMLDNILCARVMIMKKKNRKIPGLLEFRVWKR